MTLRSRYVLNLLLSAVVLAGGVQPPGLRHAHADADRPHRHHADGQHDEHRGDHHHHHDHQGPDHHHPHQVEPDLEALPGHTLHIHLRLFGFDLTIPDSSDGDSDRGTRLVDEAGTLVRFVDDPLPDYGRAMEWLGELALAIGLPCIGDVPTPVPILAPPPPITSPPLCDAARHERSGVLLI